MLQNFSIQVHGVYGSGKLGPVPSDLEMQLSLNQLHQLDPAIVALEDRISDAVLEGRPADHLFRGGELLGNLSDALHAVRYHQRQFLVRLRVVTLHHRSAQGKASDQLSLVFNDHPLKFEAEALVTRYRTVLDAGAHLLLFSLGRKADKFGDLCKWLGRQRETEDDVVRELQGVLRRHEEWINRVSGYRHGIAHQSQFEAYRGVGFGPFGVVPARVAEYDAADFATELWANLLALLDQLFAPFARRVDNSKSA